MAVKWNIRLHTNSILTPNVTSFSLFAGDLTTSYVQSSAECCGGSQDSCGSKSVIHRSDTFCGGKTLPFEKTESSILRVICHKATADPLLLRLRASFSVLVNVTQMWRNSWEIALRLNLGKHLGELGKFDKSTQAIGGRYGSVKPVSYLCGTRTWRGGSLKRTTANFERSRSSSRDVSHSLMWRQTPVRRVYSRFLRTAVCCPVGCF